MIGLGNLGGSANLSRAFDVSADGSTVVGASDANTAYGDRVVPFDWTSGDGMKVLDPLSWGGGAAALSPDATTIVGESNRIAFRWTAAAGVVGLGALPGGYSSIAFDVSSDGSIVVGVSNSSEVGSEAFRWDASGGMVGLGFFPGGLSSWAWGISADGSTIVGSASISASAPSDQAFRWTSEGGMIGLGDLPGGSFNSTATATSADGSIIVGRGMSEAGAEAFIWDARNGMRPLADVLHSQGADLTGWTLQEARDISHDGRVVVGTGIDPIGDQVAWVATLDDPAPGVPALGPVGAMLAAMALGTSAFATARGRPPTHRTTRGTFDPAAGG
jgi:probable HAF family extracellular repeat protein